MKRDIEIAWAAGILEGEGYFGTKPKCYSPKVQCQMTDEDIVTRLAVLFGGNVLVYPQKNPKWKTIYHWTVVGNVAACVMNEILPYMGARRTEKIEQCLAIWKDRNKRFDAAEQKRNAAARDYISGKGSLRKVAKMHGTTYESVRRAALKMNGPVVQRQNASLSS